MGRDIYLDMVIVYVVDNEKIIADTLALIFTQKGYRAISFTNPLEALKAAIVQPPDILLSDVVMPEMNGIELAVEFTSRFPNCKVLLLSGQIQTTELLARARERGHDFTVLAKPIHPEDLLAAIGNLITA